MDQLIILQGNIVHTPHLGQVVCHPQSYLLARNGVVEQIVDKIPSEWSSARRYDFGEALIIPGLYDLHLHAPQYRYAGLGMDMELLEWLQTYAYPEESKYGNEEYAYEAYGYFARDLKNSFTNRASVFATVHNNGAAVLAQLLAQTGLEIYLGKLSMDANCPPEINEGETAAAAAAAWVLESQGRYENIKPIVTPRFLPSCTPGLLAALGKLTNQYGLPVQSHLSENLNEINWVRKLEPKSANYTDAYDRYGLLEGHPTVMAHCVYLSEAEMRLLKERGVFVAHCPQSNTNICSGVAPVRIMLNQGLKIGLGSDVAGGAHLSMLRVMQDTVMASKLRRTLSEPTETPITMLEAFYMASKGGGAFFGKVGSFEAGYELDALVIDDAPLHPRGYSLEQRLERAIYLAENRHLVGKFVAGRPIELD